MKRTHGEGLNDAELEGLRNDLREGLATDYCARKYNCSTRTVLKYRKRWFGGGESVHWSRGRRADDGQRHYAKLEASQPLPMRAPNALPWVTKEMLTGARAPVAKVRS